MKQTKIYHADLYGLRENKYQYLAENDVTTTEWKEINPQLPFFLFEIQDQDLLTKYNLGWTLNKIFDVNSVGIQTARDAVTIQVDEKTIWKVITDFANLSQDQIRSVYDVREDTRDWQVLLAKDDVKESGPKEDYIVPISYRLFDLRKTYYTGNTRGFISMPRSEVMNNLLNGGNIALVSCRQIISEQWQHIFVTKNITDDCYISNKTKERGYVYPLYLYPSTTANDLFSQPTTNPNGRRPNLSAEFVTEVSSRLNLSFVDDGRGDLQKTLGPEDVFYYIYALFHSPTYRQRYAEFLKIDFPRVPLTKNLTLFRELVALGETLVKLHLMETRGKNLTRFVGSGDNFVDKPRFEDGKVYINKTQYFEGVPLEVWTFYVGGYQVCEKWLKDRKLRTLSFDDIKHYNGIVSNLQETIRLMAEVDEAVNKQGGFPLE